LYVVCELTNLIQGFAVTYNDDKSLSFTQVYNSTTHGGTDPVPAGTSAAEITLSVSHDPYSGCFLLRKSC
jgi:hypothetical protein